MAALLSVEDLRLGFGTGADVVCNVSFALQPGETLALVGESGSGKTLTCRSVLRILPGTAQIRGGQILFGKNHVDLLKLPDRKMRKIRGRDVSMIFQEPMRSLSPLHKIGNQVAEVLRVHENLSADKAKKRVLDTFDQVGFPDVERAYRSYPFEMSGGMRQRAMIAMAMVSRPELLIADEPTTALDVTTQAQVLGLIKDLQRDTGMGLILVTHDLGVVANMAEKVVVMQTGRVVESGPAAPVLSTPAHGYTQKLLAAAPMIPEVDEAVPALKLEDPILRMTHVTKTFTLKSSGWRSPKTVTACQDVNITVPRGKTVAIVGESGSGKTTAARIALAAEMPDEGAEIWFSPTSGADPVPVHNMSQKQRRDFQRQAQMVFQDPYSSLSPRMRIREALTEPMEIHGIGTRAEQRDKAAEMLKLVGLDPSMMNRYPHAFSGGQRQRLSIARALTLDPTLLICDEPTSALDVSVQEQVLTLLEEIRDKAGLSYLFISHDLAVVARLADEVAVMRQGFIVEQAPPDTLFHNPKHPYTKALIAAQPEPDIHRPIDLAQVAQGAGDSQSWPDPFGFDGHTPPALMEVEPGHKVRCHA